MAVTLLFGRMCFLADISDPRSPKITLAEQATVVGGQHHDLRMRLRNGEQHEMPPERPGAYSISTFAQTDLPIQITAADRKPPASATAMCPFWQ